MPRVQWPLSHGRPCVQLILTLAQTGEPLPRILLADTGAGSQNSGFELVLDEDDCLHCGGLPGHMINLGGAYTGLFPTYDLLVQLPALGFVQNVRVVAVPSVPVGLDGIACFPYFGDVSQFALEV